ncbi:MAG: hypothetical protein FWC95_05665, partial [Defluviitaleaceae bacterium]|nr:hypothetical protein [Defluviitaleaceae bacterium]
TRITVNSIFGENTTVWARWNTAVDILNLNTDMNFNQISVTDEYINIEISATYHASLDWRLYEWRILGGLPSLITPGWQTIEPTNQIHPMRRLQIPRILLNVGQRYILHVQAIDATGNPATVSRVFNITNIDLRHVNIDITQLQDTHTPPYSNIVHPLTIPRDGANAGLTVTVASTLGAEQLWELRQTAPYERRYRQD